MTVVVRIEGREDDVLADGNRLIGMVADDLERSRLLRLRLEHDVEGFPGRVVERGTDVLDLVTTGPDSPEEADLWRLVVRAGAKVGAIGGRDAPRVGR